MEQGEIILYQPDELIKLEVRVENETVWLTQTQMVELFQRDQSVIARHIGNIFKEHEIEEKSNMQNMHIANSDKPIKLYSLDVIISVGYRVKSQRGTKFRQFANKVIKEYMLKGYAINQRIEHLERTVAVHGEKIDFFVRTSLPPVEGIFFDGQIFDAYVFSAQLVKSARSSLLLIDNYVDESVLLLFSKRAQGVTATIYTKQITPQLQLDLARHNSQYPQVDIRTCQQAHDRFLIIDNIEVYHIGASLKDLGKKLFAFSKMEMPATIILNSL